MTHTDTDTEGTQMDRHELISKIVELIGRGYGYRIGSKKVDGTLPQLYDIRITLTKDGENPEVFPVASQLDGMQTIDAGDALKVAIADMLTAQDAPTPAPRATRGAPRAERAPRVPAAQAAAPEVQAPRPPTNREIGQAGATEFLIEKLGGTNPQDIIDANDPEQLQNLVTITGQDVPANFLSLPKTDLGFWETIVGIGMVARERLMRFRTPIIN